MPDDMTGRKAGKQASKHPSNKGIQIRFASLFLSRKV